MPAGRADRQLIAIVVADVVGYSRLMAADEAGTLARFDGLRAEILDPLIEDHRGRLVKVAGDGFLLAFASVADALACALAWQEAVEARAAQVPEDRTLRFRIGVHVGEVRAKDGDIFGDAVNIATRLQEIAAPGAAFVSQTVADHAAGERAVRFEDLGSKSLKNIPGRVHVYRASRAVVPRAAAGPVVRQGKRLALIAAAAVILGVAAMALWLEPWQPPRQPARIEAMAYPLPDKPSIAVLPFANMSDDPEQGYLADGMTEDLITDLANISGLFVISRNSVFTYKDEPVEIRRVGEELGVRYVLEGSVRRFGDQLRVTGQLIDATTGGHLWAENYDGSVENIFAFQDEVRARIVDSLAVVLTPEERQTLADAGTESVEAYEHYLKGMALLNQEQFLVIDPLIEARRELEQAIELDPNYGRAVAALAWSEYLYAIYLEDAMGLDRVFRMAEEALNKQETALGYLVLSKRHFRPRAYDMGSGHAEAAALLERALALEPGNADIMAELSLVLVFKGDIDRAAALIAEAKRLNPSYPAWYRRASGMVLYFQEAYDAAAEDFRVWRDKEPVPSASQGALWLAAAQAMAGKTIAAEQTLTPFRQAHPTYTTRGLSAGYAFAEPEMWEAFEEGLVAAGMPPPPE